MGDTVRMASCHPDRRDHAKGLCTKCYKLNWYHTNPHAKTKHTDVERQKRTGVDRTTYDAMLAAQNGVCAICGRPEKAENRSLAADHNHATGKPRQLLCTSCNTRLGHYEKNPGLYRKFNAYLEKHKAT